MFVTALPNADEDWVATVSTDDVFALVDSEDVRFLAERPVVFHCGCDQRTVLGVLVGAFGDSTHSLFSADEQVVVECPRCAATYTVTRREYNDARAAEGGDP